MLPIYQTLLYPEFLKCTAGEEITELHKNWISMTWGQYRPEAHKGLAEMYVKLKMNVFWNIMMKKCQDVQSF